MSYLPQYLLCSLYYFTSCALFFVDIRRSYARAECTFSLTFVAHFSSRWCPSLTTVRAAKWYTCQLQSYVHAQIKAAFKNLFYVCFLHHVRSIYPSTSSRRCLPWRSNLAYSVDNLIETTRIQMCRYNLPLS